MKVLLSIKPEYVDKIFSGEKKFEYRKKIWKSDDIDTVIVYASTPISRVIGEFTFSSIMTTDPETLWTFTHTKSGISMDEFVKYFAWSSEGHAISIETAVLYDERKELSDYGIARPPQNFMYLPEDTE